MNKYTKSYQHIYVQLLIKSLQKPFIVFKNNWCIKMSRIVTLCKYTIFTYNYNALIQMISFSNIYPVTLDGKGRVVLPAPFKKELGDTEDAKFVVEKDPYEPCLNIYPNATWELKVEKIRVKLNPDNPIHGKMLSRYYENIVKLGMAENGRLNIPDNMLEYAGITRDALFTGQGQRMRLWEPSRHDASQISEEEYLKFYKEIMGGTTDNF